MRQVLPRDGRGQVHPVVEPARVAPRREKGRGAACPSRPGALPRPMQLQSRTTVATLMSLGLLSCSSEATGRDAAGPGDASLPDALAFADALGVADALAFADALTFADASEPLDADAPMDAGSACPPAGPFGVRAGDVLPSPALVDCEGRPFDLHSLCGKTAAWQFHFAGW